MRTIEIYISDALTSSVGNLGPQGLGQTWNGVYEENLVVPCRPIVFYGDGIKIGTNEVGSSGVFGNILKEYSKGRLFGCSSSDLRPCALFYGKMNVRDSHIRLRNGIHIGGYCRTTILNRLLDSIQGNGVNQITVHLASGQNPYWIAVTPGGTQGGTNPFIRISIQNTTNYNGLYDITSKVDDTTFIATRTAGTNANTGIETSGKFYETDSAGATGLTHDSAFINCYMQGAYSCDDNIANGAAPTAGSEVMYAINSRFYTGIEGRTIFLQRVEDTTFAGASIVSSISGVNNCSFVGTLSVNSFTYSTDDMGWMNNRFNSAVPFTVTAAGQTVRMDAVTLNSFLGAGCTWVTNTPTIDYLDRDLAIKNTSTVAGATIKDALNNCAVKSAISTTFTTTDGKTVTVTNGVITGVV